MGMGSHGIRQPAGGFTLVAAVIATACVAAAVLAVVFLARREPAAGRSRAGTLAAETAEELLAARDTDPELAPGAHADRANPRDGVYDVCWSVAPAMRACRITVTVARHGVPEAPDARLVVERPDD